MRNDVPQAGLGTGMVADVVAVSVISHGHGAMIESLLEKLVICPSVGQVILTLNVPEAVDLERFHGRVTVVRNSVPQGFGANHNAAFALCEKSYFCPLNPDIEFSGDPFQVLVDHLIEMRDVGVSAPLATARNGEIEDNFRRFPTVSGLFSKVVVGAQGAYSVSVGEPVFFAEWVAGMFMLFRSEAYRHLGGFDEGFFLYYEDVDICVRAWRRGMKVLACPDVVVVHDARRESRRKLRFLCWHVSSMLRYFCKHWGRLPCLNTMVVRPR